LRKKIIELLKNLGICDDFIIGNGAQHSTSKIHYKIDKNSSRLACKHYAIQFEQESKTIAMWDLRERLAKSASLDLYVQPDLMWNNISDINCYNVAIGKRNSGIDSKVATMPFKQFESFLNFNNEFGFEFSIDNTDFENDDYVSIDIVGSATEGKMIYHYGKRYERNTAIRNAAIKSQGYICKVCGFDFEEFYGEVGHEYIEVHHIKPLCEGEQTPDPKTDLIVICSNCHKMIHRNKKKTLSPEELKKQIKKRIL
jgi:predicted HNH restriction endonuclease